MDACRLGVCAHITERGRERRQRGTSLFSSLKRNSHRPIIWAVPVISIGESPQDHEMQRIPWTLGEIPRPPSASAPDKHEVTWWMKTWQRAQKEELCKTTSVSSCTPAPHCLGAPSCSHCVLCNETGQSLGTARLTVGVRTHWADIHGDQQIDTCRHTLAQCFSPLFFFKSS